MKGYIYQIINLQNDKRYIGQTINFEKRKYEHLRRLHLNQHINKHLQSAFNKYGEDSFKIEVDEYENITIEQLRQKEKIKIEEYDSFNNGYNMSLGGEGEFIPRFSYEDYCFIKIGVNHFNMMTTRVSKYFHVSHGVIVNIKNNNTYRPFYEKFQQEDEEYLQELLQNFIEIFNIDINNLPLDKERQIMTKEEVLQSLCMIFYYEDISETLSRYFNCSHAIFSRLKKQQSKKYDIIYIQFNSMSIEQKSKIAKDAFIEWNLEPLIMEHRKEGTNVKSAILTFDTFNFIFAAQELAINYSKVAEFLGISKNTVKCWYNHTSRKDCFERYVLLSNDEKIKYKEKVQRFLPQHTFTH